MESSIRRWLYSTNAKDIGTLYIIFAIVAGLIGTSMSMVMRMELGGAGNNIIGSNQTYNILITAHGFVMIFYLIMPALLGGFGKEDLRLKTLNNCKWLFCRRFTYKVEKGTDWGGEYLAGLIEGDGSIIVPKEGGRNNPNIKIAFNEKDEGLAKKLKRDLEMGELNKGKGRYYIWEIRRKGDLERMVKLINGRMRTPKIEALGRLIEWLNKRIENKLELKGLEERGIGSNGWLAGLSDADGNFQVAIQERKGRMARIRGYYRLEIRRKYHRGEESYMNIMREIAEYLGVNLMSRSRSNGESTYESFIIMTSNKRSRGILEEYLERNKLRSSKYWDYKDWKEILKKVEEGEHKNKEGLRRCKELKKGMNNGRRDTSWRHLQ